MCRRAKRFAARCANIWGWLADSRRIARAVYKQSCPVYTVSMSKTLIDLDDDALDAAQRELGTTTKKDTVNAALAYVAERGSRSSRRCTNAFDVWGEDIANSEVMKDARR